MNERELGQASFDCFKAIEAFRNHVGHWQRMLKDVKEYAADYENQDSDMKYARMLGLYEGFCAALDHDLDELENDIDEGYSAALYLTGGSK